METKPPAGERLFVVFVTIFGALFTNGLLFIVGSEHFVVGVAFALIGLCGLIVLIRDRVKRIPVRTPMLVVGVCFVAIFLGYIPYALSRTNTKLEVYVLPRSLTSVQSTALKASLSKHEAHSVSVKVNPLDAEAREYAAQIFNALKQTNWDVDFNTTSGEPSTANDGLCIDEMGMNAKPNDPKHDPREILAEAFQDAKIEVSCGGGVAAGDYHLFVLVGHRPLAIQNESPIHKLGRWIMQMGD